MPKAEIITHIDGNIYNQVTIYNSTQKNIVFYSKNWTTSYFDSLENFSNINLSSKSIVIRPGGQLQSSQVSKTTSFDKAPARHISSFGNIMKKDI